MANFNYIKVKYECTDTGKVHPMEVRKATADVCKSSTKAIDSGLSVKLSKSRNERGIRPRGVVIVRTFGSGETAGSKRSFVPICSQAELDKLKEGADFSYNGKTFKILHHVLEDVD